MGTNQPADPTRHSHEPQACAGGDRHTLSEGDSGPSIQNVSDPGKFNQVPIDLVEEESMESFPASDSPGRSVIRTGGRGPGQA
jgi:hypothetical protein